MPELISLLSPIPCSQSLSDGSNVGQKHQHRCDENEKTTRKEAILTSDPLKARCNPTHPPVRMQDSTITGLNKHLPSLLSTHLHCPYSLHAALSSSSSSHPPPQPHCACTHCMIRPSRVARAVPVIVSNRYRLVTFPIPV
eukprot:765063-Hanusia_phi.AAC.6